MATFPPATWQDIFAYPDDDVIAGYREYRPNEPEPGANHAPGYRWGWANRKRDATGEDDGYSAVRSQYYAACPNLIETMH